MRRLISIYVMVLVLLLHSTAVFAQSSWISYNSAGVNAQIFGTDELLLYRSGSGLVNVGDIANGYSSLSFMDFLLDMNNNLITDVGAVQFQSDRNQPACISSLEGSIFYNSTSKLLNFCDDTGITQVFSVGGIGMANLVDDVTPEAGGNMEFGVFTITGLASDGQIIFNSNGSLIGEDAFKYDEDSDTMTFTGDIQTLNSLTTGKAKTDITVAATGWAQSVGTYADGTANLYQILAQRSDDNDSIAPIFALARTKNIGAAPTAVDDNAVLGLIVAIGYDGTDFAQGGQIRFSVDGTPGTDDMPTMLDFRLSPDNLQVPASVFILNHEGSLEVSQEITTPANPSANAHKLYFKTDDKLYSLNDAGAEIDLTASDVTSVFTRTGAVVAASGDYTASEVTNVAAGAIVAVTVQAAIDELDTEKVAVSVGSDTQVLFNNSNTVSGDAGLTYNAGTDALTVAGNTLTSLLSCSPSTTQAITAISDTISASSCFLEATPDADYVMTGTPSIAAGVNGQILILHNTSATKTMALQDDSILAGSDVFLGGAESTIKPFSTMLLHYTTDVGSVGWHVISNPNSASAGASAELIPVRNTSGGAFSAGDLVYVTGYNTGQARITVGLADANGAGTFPAIGFVTSALGNNANGTVAVLGDLLALVDTNTASAGDGIWMSTTPGGVVFTRPATDRVQQVGIVTRSNASGNIFILGAGRVNDVPNAMTAVTLVLTGDIDAANHCDEVGANCVDTAVILVDGDIGGSVQAFDAVLDDLSALAVIADNEVIVGTGAGTYANESGGTLHTSMGLAIGTNVQAFDAVLDDLSALSAIADNEFMVGTAAGVYANEDPATARTSMGVDAAGTDNSTDVTLSGTGTYIALTAQDIQVDQIVWSDDHATGVDGTVPTFDAAGLPVFIPVGTAGDVLTSNGDGTEPIFQVIPTQTESLCVAISDETTDIETGTANITFRMPYAFTLTDIRASVNTAPTGSVIIIDVHESGTTIMTTDKLSIDATEKTTESAATPPALTDTSLADDAEMTVDIDQIGSSIAGKGAKVCLIGTQT